MVFSRVRCHYCGTKQPHRKQVTQFQCTTCEAVNFLDGKGNVVDTPVAVVAQSTPAPYVVRQPTPGLLPSSADSQQQPVFCRTCQQNQHLYNETLANYLPDDDDPRYLEFERRLPQFKADLEKRYPLVCTKCAPKAQQQIHQSDYYGMSQNAAKLCADTRSRGGRRTQGARDDRTKMAARTALYIVDKVMWLGLLTQILYHVYGIFSTLRGDSDFASEPTLVNCAIRSTILRPDASCHDLLGTYAGKSIVLATLLLPYNTGYKYWFDATDRMEAVHGQKNYFVLQLILLFVRCLAWQTMSNPAAVEGFTQSQILVIHGFVALLMPLVQWMASRSIRPVKWKVRGSIMPSPAERDVLGKTAGPGQERHIPQASGEDPFRLLQRTEPSMFRASQETKKPTSPQRPYLSPEESDDSDAMETDFEPIMRSSRRFASPRPNIQPTHTWFNHTNAPSLGLSDMRSQLDGVEEEVRRQQERALQQQQTGQRYTSPTFSNEPNRSTFGSAAASGPRPPFSIPVPPAPMSQERRLRNPWAVQKAEETAPVPLSQQKDFMAKMRTGVTPVKLVGQDPGFQMQKGKLKLASDNKETGLEDRFNNYFGIEDGSPRRQDGSGGGWFSGLIRR